MWCPFLWKKKFAKKKKKNNSDQESTSYPTLPRLTQWHFEESIEEKTKNGRNSYIPPQHEGIGDNTPSHYDTPRKLYETPISTTFPIDETLIDMAPEYSDTPINELPQYDEIAPGLPYRSARSSSVDSISLYAYVRPLSVSSNIYEELSLYEELYLKILGDKEGEDEECHASYESLTSFLNLGESLIEDYYKIINKVENDELKTDRQVSTGSKK